MANSLFQNIRACARGRKDFSGYIQKVREVEFLKLVRVRIELQVSEVRKNENLTLEISIWIKNSELISSNKTRLHQPKTKSMWG